MVDQFFFNEAKEQSLVKADIVAKYFWAWAKVMIPQAKKRNSNIAYIDLFAGPGRYKDGSKSTPLLILERAINDPDMQKMLITFFNDINPENTNSLQKEIDSLTNINKLKNKPIISNKSIGEEIIQEIKKIKIPSLYFIDPWGYKGLSIKLIESAIMKWGCDCIFFFNYNRINMGINNLLVREHINALFGESRANKLRNQIQLKQTPKQKELLIENAIIESLNKIDGKYVLSFQFNHEKINCTSHHLIFVSKNIEDMK